MKTLKVKIADEVKTLNQAQFDQLLNGMFGKEECWIQTYNPRHPFMQNVYLTKTKNGSIFSDICTMLPKGFELSIMSRDGSHAEMVVSK